MENKEKPISGIYGIYCAGSDQWYIGASKNIIKRLKYHFRDMRTDASSKRHADFIGREYRWGYHGRIGHDYWYYGEGAFTCHIIEEVADTAQFRRFEDFYISLFDSVTHGYNYQTAGNHRDW